MNINKMVHGCPWRHPQRIYLQVLFSLPLCSLIFIRKYLNCCSNSSFLSFLCFAPSCDEVCNDLAGYISHWKKVCIYSFSTSFEVNVNQWAESSVFCWWCQASFMVGWNVSYAHYSAFICCISWKIVNLCWQVYIALYLLTLRCMAEYLPHLEESLEKQVGFFVW